jgi:hypothetical protein
VPAELFLYIYFAQVNEMELERRVKTLEQEIKILKNQIQTTLREIQEQVLIHYYPALRAGSDAQTGKKPPKANPDSEEPNFEEKEFEKWDPGAKVPTVKTISLDDLRAQREAAAKEAAKEAAISPGLPPAPPTAPGEPTTENENGAPPENGSELTRLTDWMVNSVADMGIQNTRQMLEMRIKANPSPEAEKLHQFLTIFGEEKADMPVFKDMVNSFLRMNADM